MTFTLKRAFLAGACLVLSGCASTGPLVDPAKLFGTDKTDKDAKDETKALVTNGLPTDIESAVVQAQTKRKENDLSGATRILSQLVLIAPDDPRVLGEYGKTLVAQGRSDDALAFLERAIELQPANWSLFSAQGVAYDQKAQYPAAQASYGRALLLNPGEPVVLSNNALSHMQAGDLDGAERLLLQASQSGGENPRITSNLELVRSLRAKGSEKAIAETATNTPPANLAVPPSAERSVAEEAAPAYDEPAPEATASVPAEEPSPAPEATASVTVPEETTPEPEATASATPPETVPVPTPAETPPVAAATAAEPLPVEEIEEGATETASVASPPPPAIDATPLAPPSEFDVSEESPSSAPAEAAEPVKSEPAVVAQQAPKDVQAKPRRQPAKPAVAVAKPKPAEPTTKTATADVVGPPGSSTSFLRPAVSGTDSARQQANAGK